MSDADKTPEELMAELRALRQRVEELEEQTGSQETRAASFEDIPEETPPKGPKVSEDEAGLTKRQLLHASWVAPVILTVNLPMSVFAQSQGSPGPNPNPSPTLPPIPTPTGGPPTAPPPTAPPPTGAPTGTTVAPTGTTTAKPTTAAPTTAKPTTAAPTTATPTGPPTFKPPTLGPTPAPTFPPGPS